MFTNLISHDFILRVVYIYSIYAILYADTVLNHFICATTDFIQTTHSSCVVIVANYICMFKSIGMILVIWYLSSLFSASFDAADRAITATFNALEATARSAKITIPAPTPIP